MSDDQRMDRGEDRSGGSVTLDQEQLARLENALARLHPKDRTIFLAACRRELSYHEIAQRHRCTATKAQRIVARVLIKLHKAVWPGGRS